MPPEANVERHDVAAFPERGACERLSHWLAAQGVTDSPVLHASRLSGGAVQENWRLQLDSGDSLVLRTDADAAIPTSCTRSEEYLRYQLAFQHGARVAKPYAFCEDLSVIGKPFFILQFVRGATAGHVLVKDDKCVPDRASLVKELGKHLGVIHSTPHDAVRTVLGDPPEYAVRQAIHHLRLQLDALRSPNPALDLCMRELEIRLGNGEHVAFTHGDYRTGNYMVDEGKVSAILDWEFSGWGDPLEDLGWFTAPCWRFGRRESGAGGIGPIESFLEGYRESTGIEVKPAQLRDWQALAHVKWAVIALHQEERHASGAQRSLELALSGRVVAGVALEAMNLLDIR